ncbi:MAG: hypothetical protein ACRDVN_12475 [Jiangellaceae bacterium]
MSTGADTSEPQVYRVPTGVALRGVGIGAVGLGLCVMGAMVLSALEPSRAVLVGVGLLIGLLAVLALTMFVVGVLRLAGRGARLELDDEGFLNSTGPGGGVRRAAWRDVRRVQSDGPVVSVDLSAGRRSIIRTGVLDVEPRELAREMRARLVRRNPARPPA